MPTMRRPRLALFLVDRDNVYQRVLQADAELAAGRVGADLEVHWCARDAGQQIKAVYARLQVAPPSRPDALLVMPHRDSVLARAASDAARLGVGLAVLNREPALLDGVRRQFPGALVVSFTPDQRAIGRIQGEQLRSLLPGGGRVAYVRGERVTAVSRERQAGLEEVIARAPIGMDVLEGGWAREKARRVVTSWLRSMAIERTPVHAVTCQNDDMALGAREAVDALAAELGRPDLQGILVTGCDGLPEEGQRHVSAGVLAATVVNPLTAGPAVESLAAYYTTGVRPPPRTILEARSFPSQKALALRGKMGSGRAAGPG